MRLTTLIAVGGALLAGAFSFALVARADDSAVFGIDVVYRGGLTLGEEAVFAEAANYWDHIITGYKPGVTNVYGITIEASAKSIDGAGGVLASTSVENYQWATVGTTTYTFTNTSSITVDSADISTLYNEGALYPVLLHEMAHALGFGTVWDMNTGVYVDGSGQYTGAAALAAYRSEFVGQQNATYVPVELAGGSGCADSHWADTYLGAGPTGIVDTHGRDMEYELMVPWMHVEAPSSVFISQTTIHQFEDLGYTVLKLPGDANSDGFVNGADLNTVLSNYNLTGATWAQGDFNGDGTVNGMDLNTLLSNYNENNGIYGTFGPGGSGDSSLTMAVPEPGALSMLALGVVGILAWTARRKRR